MPPFPVGPKILGARDVFRLAGLVSAAKQYDQFFSMSCAVDSVSGSNIDAQLQDPFPDGFAVTKIAGLYLTKPLNDP